MEVSGMGIIVLTWSPALKSPPVSKSNRNAININDTRPNYDLSFFWKESYNHSQRRHDRSQMDQIPRPSRRYWWKRTVNLPKQHKHQTMVAMNHYTYSSLFIINFSFFLISENTISTTDLLKGFFALWSVVLVWMHLDGELVTSRRIRILILSYTPSWSPPLLQSCRRWESCSNLMFLKLHWRSWLVPMHQTESSWNTSV